jgi:hypothetical protein
MELSPIVLQKRVAISSWASLIEDWGTPGKIFSTTKQNPSERQQILRDLRQMGKNLVMVKDPEETMELLAAPGGDPIGIHKEFISWANQEISKMILGHDSLQGVSGKISGSYASSKDGSDEFHRRLACKVMEIDSYVNDYLIPRWETMEYIPAGTLEFKHNSIDNLGPDELNEYLKTILPYYIVDAKEIADNFGVKITGDRVQQSSFQNNSEDNANEETSTE